MASATTRALCVLLLTAMAVNTVIRPLAAEPTQLETVQQRLKNATDCSDELGKLADSIDEGNVLDDCGSSAVDPLYAIYAVFYNFNTSFADLDADHKLTPFEDADAKQVVDLLTTFVKAHQTALNILINKSEIISVGFFCHVTIKDGLVELERLLKTSASYLLRVVPTQKPAAEAQIDSLNTLLAKAVYAYTYSSDLVTA